MNNKKPFRSLPHKWEKQYIIYTKDPIKEIWNSLRDFTSYEYLKRFLTDRIGDSEIDEIIKHNSKEVLHIGGLTNNVAIEKIPLFQNLINQANDFYFASTNLPLLSQPILLFYSFETLAQFLFQSTYNLNKKRKYTHGLYYDSQKHILEVKQEGLFQDFHISHSKGMMKCHSFELEEIINCGSINPIELESYSGKLYSHNITDTKGENVSLTELDREFMFIFSISVLARYNILEWVKILDGTKLDNLDADIGIFIRRYINTTKLIFPILILNELRRKSCFFFEPGRFMADEWDKYDDKTK
ncbi:YaaC family protein [Candidatus Nitrosocosmicus franklandus]|uniref:YaaC family protein n=1 Tax=Candidatus Nitrosocosmicus franklandianus TaxID=1798806 RepID=UPI0010699E7A|nr:hypothetical protein [Candidatus Nitrosocosmicus franklandus]